MNAQVEDDRNSLHLKWIDFSVPWTCVHFFCALTDDRPLVSQYTRRHQMKDLDFISIQVPL